MRTTSIIWGRQDICHIYLLAHKLQCIWSQNSSWRAWSSLQWNKLIQHIRCGRLQRLVLPVGETIHTVMLSNSVVCLFRPSPTGKGGNPHPVARRLLNLHVHNLWDPPWQQHPCNALRRAGTLQSAVSENLIMYNSQLSQILAASISVT